MTRFIEVNSAMARNFSRMAISIDLITRVTAERREFGPSMAHCRVYGRTSHQSWWVTETYEQVMEQLRENPK